MYALCIRATQAVVNNAERISATALSGHPNMIDMIKALIGG